MDYVALLRNLRMHLKPIILVDAYRTLVISILTKPFQEIPMNALIKFLVMFASALILAGCAGPTLPPANASYFSDAPAREGYATLYVYRPAHRFGTAVWPEVLLNGRKTVGLKNGSYSVIYVKPGKYELTSDKSDPLSGMRNHPATFEIPENGVYFLKYEQSGEPTNKGITVSEIKRATYGGGIAVHTRWALFTRQEALPEISQCYYVIPYAQQVPE